METNFTSKAVVDLQLLLLDTATAPAFVEFLGVISIDLL